jgi:hypothetical protein
MPNIPRTTILFPGLPPSLLYHRPFEIEQNHHHFSRTPDRRALEQAQRLPHIPRQGLSKSITIVMENEEETPPESAIVKAFQSFIKKQPKLNQKLEESDETGRAN